MIKHFTIGSASPHLPPPRDAGPIFRVTIAEGPTVWAVHGYHALKTVLTDTESYSRNWKSWDDLAEGRIPDGWSIKELIQRTNMLTTDGVEHRRLRSPLARAFTPRQVERLRPLIDSAAVELLKPLGDIDVPVDIRKDFSLPLTLTMFAQLLGIPEESRDELTTNVTRIFGASAGVTPAEFTAANNWLADYLKSLIEIKRNDPQDDLTSALISNSDKHEQLNEQELVATAFLLIVAGFETTAGAIVSAVHSLLAEPSQLQLARNHHATWKQVAEESIRYDGVVSALPFAYPTRDVVIEGTAVPKGSAILLCYGGAGLDPSVYSDPHSFNVLRDDAERHLGFGIGPHHCLGAPLARMELEIALSRLFEMYPNTAIHDADKGLSYSPSIMAKHPVDLLVNLSD